MPVVTVRAVVAPPPTAAFRQVPPNDDPPPLDLVPVHLLDGLLGEVDRLELDDAGALGLALVVGVNLRELDGPNCSEDNKRLLI